MTDIIVLLVVAAALFFCIRSIIRNKKRGGSSCGCAGCSGCSSACACGDKRKNPEYRPGSSFHRIDFFIIFIDFKALRGYSNQPGSDGHINILKNIRI